MRTLYNPTVVIKVPRQSYKAANERGILREFLFYCTLKTINIEGVLRRGTIIPFCKEKTGLSESSIRAKLKQLSDLQWIKRDCKGNVSVCKYDVVWNTLGIDKQDKDGKKIFRIDSGNYQELKSKIEVNEIKDCLLQQSFRVRSSFLKELGNEDTARKPSVLSKIRKRILNTIDFSKLFLYRSKKILKGSQYSYNCDVSLSCLGVARLLGYTSAMQGCLIEKELMKAELLQVERRILYVGEGYYTEGLPKGCFVSKNGKILKQLPNKLTPLV